MTEMVENSQGKGDSIVINETEVPAKKPGVTIREEIEDDGKYILYNAQDELILVTNSTGKFILDRCTDEKTVGQIINDIENEFSIKEDIDMPAIVKSYVSTLLKANLISLQGKER